MSLKKDILWRVGIVYLGFLCFGIWIIAKIIYLQTFEREKWKEEARKVVLKNVTIPSNRGNIYTADGRLLATSIPYYQIRIDLKTPALTDKVFYGKIDSLAFCLYRLFRNESSNTAYDYKQNLIAARKRGERFYMVKNRVNYIQLQELKKFPIFRDGRYKGGLIVIQKDMRVLPHENLATRFIGFTTQTNISVGIEGAYNHQLAGTQGISLKQKLPGNVWMPVKDNNEVDPKDGMDVYTTIDINLQDVADKALRQQLINQEADHGTAVLMEVNTGRIRAIVNLGKDKSGNYRELQNYAVAESMEPGSTFKLPVIIAALEDGYIDLHDTIDTKNGVLNYYDIVIKDENYWKGGSGKTTLKHAFEISSNVAMVKVITGAYKGREHHFIDRLYNMRLNEKLGLEIKGEGQPYIKYPKDKLWTGISLGMMSHGYEVELTPLQLLTFYNAIANNGKMVKPRFADEIKFHGRRIKSINTVVLDHSVCSRSTLQKARMLLEGVVENGTARNLKVPDIKIAGKTGTSQIYNVASGSYKSEHGTRYQASFVGYFPADKPKYSCIVVISNPTKDIYHGNEVAGPVFLEIARKVNALDLEQQLQFSLNAPVIADLPYSKDGLKSELSVVAKELDVKIEQKDSNADWITTAKKENSIEIREKKIIPNLVPNVMMMGAKDAVYLLENKGLKVIVNGRGSVRNQSIPPGARIRKGDIIELEMSFI
ncbi:MAG: penicillin-binding protein [Bacteroidales bacterium]